MATGPDRGKTKSGLSDLPGHLLRRCHQISVAIFLEELAGFDITPMQFAVLKTLIENGQMDQATIGGLAALDRTTVTVVIQKLEERGLVHRKQSEKDKRSKMVSVSKSGSDLIRDVNDAVEKAQVRTVQPLDPNERAEFMRLLRKVAEANNSFSRAPMRLAKEA